MGWFLRGCRLLAALGVLFAAPALWAQETASAPADAEPTSATAASLRKVLATLEDEISQAQTEWDGLSTRIGDAKEELTAITAQVSKIGLEKDAAEARVAELEKRQRSLDADIRAREDLLAEHVQTLQDVGARLEAGEAQLAALEDRIAAETAEAGQIDAQMEETRALNARVEELRALKSGLEAELSSLGQRKAETEAAVQAQQEMTASLAGLSQDRDHLAAELERLEAARAAAAAEADAAFKRRDEALSALKEGEDNVAATQAALGDLQQQATAQRDRIAELTTAAEASAAQASAAAEARDAVTALEAREAELRATLLGLEEDITAKRDALDLAKAELAEVSAARDSDATAVETAPAKIDAAVNQAMSDDQTGATSQAQADIRALLVNAPGLAGADADQIEKLAGDLASGTCPTDALNAAFGAINRQTLLYLMTTMGGC